MSQFLQEEIIEQLSCLPDAQQQQVLAYARSLSPSKPFGVPGETMLQFAGMIPLDELEQMERDIEEGCEQIDLSQW